jgi:hypothetical protein
VTVFVREMSATPEISKQIRVLSVSADPALSYTQGLLLLSHGFEVETAVSKSYAQELIQSNSFDLLVFGNRLTPETCRELAESFRLRNPSGKIIEVVSANWDARVNEPDAIAVGPEGLIAAIRQIAQA